MWKLLVEGIEVQFSDFPEELQEKLYLKNKEKFQIEVANSQYKDIRRLLIEDNRTTDEILKQILDIEMRKPVCISNVVSILKHPNFKKYKAILDELAQSEDQVKRRIAAMASNSSEFLNNMLQNELNRNNGLYIISFILDNPSFKADEVTLGKLAQSRYSEERKIAARLSNSSEFLNKMNQNELDGEDDIDVKNTIFHNPNFKQDEVTYSKVIQSVEMEHRQRAMRKSNSSLIRWRR